MRCSESVFITELHGEIRAFYAFEKTDFALCLTHYRRNGSVCSCTDNRLNTECHERKPLDAL